MNRLAALIMILSISGLGTACSSTVAQEAAPGRGEPRVINTSGHAIVHVAPDRAELTLGVETRDKQLETAKSENDARVRELMAIIGQHGIDAKDVHTSWLSIHQEYSSYSLGRKFEGYRVSNTIMVTFEDISLVESVLSDALTGGVTNVGNVSFRHSEDRTHRDRAREMAVKAAREKAEAMAKALGQRVGRPVTITETMPTWMNPVGNANFINEAAAVGSPDEGDTLAPGMVKIGARVTVAFELLD